MPRARTLVLAIPWTWLGLFLLLPTAIVLKIALAQGADGVPPYTPLLHWIGGAPRLRITWDNFSLILTDPLYRGAFVHSLRVAGLSTLICLLMGYPMALAIARVPERWRNPLLLALMLPFWTGFLMRINAWIGLLQDNGWINAALVFCHLSPLRLLYTDMAMYIGIVYTYLPFMVLPLYARLTRLDPALLEAAGDLGAPPWRAFLAVTLPLSLPGVLGRRAAGVHPCRWRIRDSRIARRAAGATDRTRAVERVLSEPRLAYRLGAGLHAVGAAADRAPGGVVGGVRGLALDAATERRAGGVCFGPAGLAVTRRGPRNGTTGGTHCPSRVMLPAGAPSTYCGSRNRQRRGWRAVGPHDQGGGCRNAMEGGAGMTLRLGGQ